MYTLAFNVRQVNRLTIVQHNVLHWATRKNELYNTYRHLDPDIILINSHGVKEAESLKMYTYTVYKNNVSNDRNDGAAIAVKSNLAHKLVDGFRDLLAVEVETSRGPIVVATCYLPPRRPAFPFPDLIRLGRLRKASYFFGDLNARHADLGSVSDNQRGRNLSRLIADGDVRHIGPDFPTFIKEDTATSPDIVLANRHANLNVHMKAGPVTTSDHLPIVATLSTNPIVVEDARQIYNYKRADWTAWQNALQGIPNTTHLRQASLNEIEEEVDKWFSDVLLAREQFIPKRRYKRLPCPRPTPQIELTQAMFNNVKTLAQIRGWTQELRRRYLELRLELREQWTEANQRSWERLMANLEAKYSEPEDFWRHLRRLSGKSYEPKSYMLNDQNEKVWTVQEKETLHRHYWSKNFKISNAENARFDPENERRVETFHEEQGDRLQPHATADFSRLEWNNPLMRRITPREIRETIRSFKNGKAPGLSGINKMMLEKAPNKVICRLGEIFNACLSAGYFPKKFKVALIHLIPKEGNSPLRVEGKRAISLLEFPGKVFEKILNSRLVTFLEDHELYNKRQHGFRRGRGTQTALNVLYETAANAAADNMLINIVLRDVSKAFDKVWHKGLKLKLSSLGLHECFTRLLCNFLDGRTARIRLGQHIGEDIHLESGVPQGSCLSPTLYSIFTADLPPPQEGVWDYVAYADDISQIVYMYGSNQDYMARRTARAIEQVSEYEKKWKIATNQTKFQVIHLFKHPHPLTLRGVNVPYSPSGKVLGLTIASRGIKPHVAQRVGRAHSQLNMMKRFGQLSERIKTHLYKAVVRPVLEYPPVPLDTLAKTESLKLQRVQNAAIKWIANWTFPYSTTMEAEHERLNMEPINTRIHRLSRKSWLRLEAHDPESYERLSTAEPLRANHGWWRRSLPLVNRPEEVYV